MSPRPKRNRRISRPPFISGFDPVGVSVDRKSAIELHFEEYEAIKLADYDLFTHDQAAEKMNISRPTFTRIYEKARRKIAQAFVESKSIAISGGHIEFEDNWYECLHCTAVFKKDTKTKADECEVCGSEEINYLNEPIKPGHAGRKTGTGIIEEDVFCICPKCSKRIPHEAGIPCRSIMCPDCNVSMLRENSPNFYKVMKKRKKK